jgi:hypothetical protein
MYANPSQPSSASGTSRASTSWWSPENIRELIVQTENAFSKRFSRIEAHQFLTFAKAMRVTREMEAMPLQQRCLAVADAYRSYLDTQKPIDVHEMMKDVINQKGSMRSGTLVGSRVEGFANPTLANIPSSDLFDLTRIVNRESLYRDSNILLDSRYQNQSNTDRSKVAWTVVSDTRSKSPGSGTIISSGALKDIVEIEIFPFSIPYLTAADNYYNTITMSILELSSSSIDAYENAQFHFLFKSTKNGNLLDLNPVNAVFRFHKTVAKLSDLSIRFGSPLAPITFDKDRLYTKTVNYNVNPMTIEFFEDHSLLSGDIIYITDFNTLNPGQDLVPIAKINALDGHICTRQSSTIISINIDGASIRFPDASRRFLIYLGSKRLLIPMRIRYMESV